MSSSSKKYFQQQPQQHNHHNDNLSIHENNSTSTSPQGTLSSTSSSLSNSSSNSSSLKLESFYENIKIIFPNGIETVKKLDTRKAIYDILIELAASSKLQPSNYMLQLFNEDMKLLDCTPNQTLAQIGSNIIKLVPKASTIKTSTVNIIHSNGGSSISNNYNNNIGHQMNGNYNNGHINNKLILNNNNSILNSNNSHEKKPLFEITIRVQVNLPHNQITAVRVKPNIKLNDLLKVICDENALDITKYKLNVNTCNSDVDNRDANYMNNTLAYYNTNEVTLIYANNRTEQDVISRSKSEFNLHDENNNYSNPNDDDDSKSNGKKSTILNLFRKKRSRSKTSMNEDIARVKSLLNEQQNNNNNNQKQQPSQQQQYQQAEAVKRDQSQKRAAVTTGSNNDNRLSLLNDNMMFNSKKKQAPPPPPPAPSKPPVAVITAVQTTNTNGLSKDQGNKIEKTKQNEINSVLPNLQIHKKKHAPPPPPPAPVSTQSPPSISKEETIKQQEPKKEEGTELIVKKASDTDTSKTSTVTISTIDSCNTTKQTMSYSVTTEQQVKGVFNNDNSNNDNNSDSLTSSLSSRNYYEFNDENRHSLSISENDYPVMTKEKIILTSTFNANNNNNNRNSDRQLSNNNFNKCYDEYSLSNNSKTSSIEDISKSFAIAIAVGEQYVSKDEATRSAVAQSDIKTADVNEFKVFSTAKLEVQNTPQSAKAKQQIYDSPDSFILESNRVKAYNGAIIDKNTTLNSIDDFSDVDAKTDHLTNEIINNHHNKHINSNGSVYDEHESNVDSLDEYHNDNIVNISFANAKFIGDNTKIIDKLTENLNNKNETNENNREIEVIYESVYQEPMSHKNAGYHQGKTDSYYNKNDEDTKSKTSSMYSYDEHAKQSSVIYRHSVPSPPSTLSSADSSLQRHLSLSPPVDDHSSYKVIRPSDVYAKDGTYYSVDGTIRGYIGAVKKMTTSKVLAEIFNNHANGNHINGNHDKENDDAELHKQHSIGVFNAKPAVAVVKSPIVPESPKVIQKQIIEEKPPQKTNFDEKISKTTTTVVTNNTTDASKITTNNSHENKQAAVKATKSSLTNIIASEKKFNQFNYIPKTNLISSSTSKIPTIKAELTVNETQNLPSSSSNNCSSTNVTTNNNNNTKQNSNNEPAGKQNVNLNVIHQQNDHHHHQQQKISTSFVMSAKSKTSNNVNRRLTLDSPPAIDIRANLLNEIRSSVPLVEEHKPSVQLEQLNRADKNISIESTKLNGSKIEAIKPNVKKCQTLPPFNQLNAFNFLTQGSTQQPSKVPMPPPIAPKHFTLQSLNTKPQIASTYANRANLLDSIKNFNSSSLRKTNSNQ